MMKVVTALACGVVSLLASSAHAYSVSPEPQPSSSSRRQWLSSTATALAAPVLAFGLLQMPGAANAAVAATETFDDPQHGFAMQVPKGWTSSVQELNDRRCIRLWTDPADPKTGIFIAYTPVRDDFTSLQSFGAVDQVAAQTILPKGAIGGQEGVAAEMLSAESKKQAYFFDYTQAIEGVQPPTHFRTIFTLQQGATGGAGAVLVTITLQTPEERYATNKPLLDTIIDSYGKSK